MPPTNSRRSSSAACSNAPRSTSRNARSRALRPGSSKASLTAREPMPRAGKPLVQILGRPGDEARVDRLGERVAELRDAAGRGDHDDHHDVRLQQQHLDVADASPPRAAAPRRARAAG